MEKGCCRVFREQNSKKNLKAGEGEQQHEILTKKSTKFGFWYGHLMKIPSHRQIITLEEGGKLLTGKLA